jgi:hypothetical protein
MRKARPGPARRQRACWGLRRRLVVMRGGMPPGHVSRAARPRTPRDLSRGGVVSVGLAAGQQVALRGWASISRCSRSPAATASGARFVMSSGSKRSATSPETPPTDDLGELDEKRPLNVAFCRADTRPDGGTGRRHSDLRKLLCGQRPECLGWLPARTPASRLQLPLQQVCQQHCRTVGQFPLFALAHVLDLLGRVRCVQQFQTALAQEPRLLGGPGDHVVFVACGAGQGGFPGSGCCWSSPHGQPGPRATRTPICLGTARVLASPGGRSTSPPLPRHPDRNRAQ